MLCIKGIDDADVNCVYNTWTDGDVTKFTTTSPHSYIGLGSAYKSFVGTVRDVRYYFNRALTQSEIEDVSDYDQRCLAHCKVCDNFETC